MRLIDADAIVYTHEVARSLDDRHNWIELCVTQDDIECMPTIDAVEVVRCGNCTYAETATGWLSGFLLCVKDFETGCGQKMAKKKDDFCSFAERKTDETD